MTVDYADFLAAKMQRNTGHGFEPTVLPDHLFDFQRELVEWAVRQGRAGIFADCGMVGLGHVETPQPSVRRVRRDLHSIPLAGKAWASVLLTGVRRCVEAPRLRPSLRDVRRRVLPTVRGAGPRAARPTVLFARMLRRLEGGEPTGRHLREAGFGARPSHRGCRRAGSTTGPRRGGAPQGPEQAQQRPQQLGCSPLAGRSRSMPRRRYER